MTWGATSSPSHSSPLWAALATAMIGFEKAVLLNGEGFFHPKHGSELRHCQIISALHCCVIISFVPAKCQVAVILWQTNKAKEEPVIQLHLS